MTASAVHWIVQTNLGEGSGLEALMDTLRTEHVSHTAVDILPFSDELPTVDVPADHAVFFYGTTLAVANVARQRPWAPGVFFDDAAFTYTAWAQHYGAHLLNSPDETTQTTLGGSLLLGLPWDDIFVRPERDLKEFNGGVWETTAFLRFARDVVNQGGFPQLNADTPIVIGEPHGIEAEWRTFVTAEGEVLGASQYRGKGRMKHDANVPDAVRAFAAARAREWSPAPLFVLDVAQSGGHLFVVEAQCAHSAGFYATPLAPLVQGINATVLRHTAAPLVAERPTRRRSP